MDGFLGTGIRETDRYLITWVETSTCSAQVTALDLANMLGCGVSDLDSAGDLTQGLEDALAEIEEEPDVSEFLRSHIEVVKVSPAGGKHLPEAGDLA